MDLHLHLSAAFRALDHKWGKPVDLDTSDETPSHLPAVVERSTTTFSSEDFLKIIKRNRRKPYSRTEHRRKKKNAKLNDSFSNVSLARMPLHESDKEGTDKPKTYEHIHSAESSYRTLRSSSELIEGLNCIQRDFLISNAVENSTVAVDFCSAGNRKNGAKELKSLLLCCTLERSSKEK